MGIRVYLGLYEVIQGVMEKKLETTTQFSRV